MVPTYPAASLPSPWRANAYILSVAAVTSPHRPSCEVLVVPILQAEFEGAHGGHLIQSPHFADEKTKAHSEGVACSKT